MPKMILSAAVAVVVGCSLLAPNTPEALAIPGECQTTSFAGFGGGYCDQAQAADGSFSHCETASGFGISHQRCYQACMDVAGRPFPTDMDLTTPCATALTVASVPEAPAPAAPAPTAALAPAPEAPAPQAPAPTLAPAAPAPTLAPAAPAPTLAPAAPAPAPTAPVPTLIPVPTAANSPSPL